MDERMERAGNFLPRVDEAAQTNDVDRRVVTLTAPASNAAEQYRTLYYRLERMREVRPMKCIALTSSVQGEGKTVTSVNLALTAARANMDRRILLIDMDLRRGQVAEVLGIRGKPGLSELIAGDADVREVVRRFKSSPLAVIPAGTTPEDPTQVLASARMKQFLAKVRESFDEVYIDLPPTLPFADASIATPLADGVLMVIRAGVTPMRAVNQAIDALAGTPVVGCVLNGADSSATPYLKAYKRK